MKRRHFLGLAAGIGLAGAAWAYWPRLGFFNPCLTKLPKSIADSAWVHAAWEGIDARQVWDCHVHLVGVGDGGSGVGSGSGAWSNPKLDSWWHPIQYAQKLFYLNAGCVHAAPGRVDQSYIERLHNLVDGMRPGAKLMLLAFDLNHDDAGKPDRENSSFYTPNAYARAMAQQPAVALTEPDIPSWQRGAAFTDWHPQFKNPAAEQKRFLRRDNVQAGLYIAYYRNQTQQAEMIGFGNVLAMPGGNTWRRMSDSPRTLAVGNLAVRENILAHNNDRLLGWYWYWVGDRFTTSPYIAKAYLAFNRLLLRLFQSEPEIMGLTALLLIQHARAAARFDADGAVILLDDQDRSLWNKALIAEGLALIDKAMRHRRSGPYQVQAAIAALHARAEKPEDTDWTQIDLLYGALEIMQPSPVVTLNRAVAVSKVKGPQAALDMIEPLAARLSNYFHFFGVRGAFLMQLGRNDEARTAFDRAIALANTSAEAAHIRMHLDRLIRDSQPKKANGGARQGAKAK